MEWPNLRWYSHKKPAARNARCASPVPGTVAPSALGRRNRTAKTPQLCLDLLSKPKQRPGAKKRIRNASTKTLAKIQEASSQMDCLSAQQRVELNYNENRGFDMRRHMGESSAAPLEGCLHLSSASKESLQISEATSEMTLPTGVSDFLLDCLDEDSTMDSGTESSDRADSYSSPEMFRDESGVEENSVSPEECLGCKNSTLLDTSKAINIEKMPQLANLSKIDEASLGGQGECIMRGRPSKGKLRSELTKASTIVAGKQVCKILSAREKTPQPQSSAALLLPQKQQKQLNNQQSRIMKCRKKVQFGSKILLSPATLSPGGESASASHRGAATGTLDSKQPIADMVDSSIHKISNSEDLFPNMTDQRVHSEEIVPESLFQKRTIYQCLLNPPEVCCIITTSPKLRPPKILKSPLDKKRKFPSSGVTEDIISNPKNWVYNHDRCIGLQNLREDTSIKSGERADFVGTSSGTLNSNIP